MTEKVTGVYNFDFNCFICTIILALFIATGCGTPVIEQLKTEPREPVQPKPVKIESPAPKEQPYSYSLSLEKVDKPGEYSRKEIESFLCASVENFIRSEEVVSVPPTDQVPTTYFIREKKNAQHEVKKSYTAEVSKWFEERVTVTCRGRLTFLDIDVVKNFFNKVNQVIGSKKFQFKANQETANIVIEMAPPDNSENIPLYLGETTMLKDNMRTRIGINNSKIKIDEFKSGTGQLLNNSRSITYTPAEVAFRKDQRLVKCRMHNVLDPKVRHFTLVHELFHTLGFAGHSPYPESYLFPVPARAYRGRLIGLLLGTKIMTPMAEQMVSMLYRPEILPGMTVKEAALVLQHMKPRNETTHAEIRAYFQQRTVALEARKQEILITAKKKHDQRLSIYLEMARLERKELDLLAELEEIRNYKKASTRIIAEIKKTKSLVGRLGRIRREVILVESRKKKLLAQLKKEGAKKRVMHRQVRLCTEELVVLNDILKVQQESTPSQQKLMAQRTGDNSKDQEVKLRRVIRQLRFIKKQLTLFND